jgi:uncharacterized protein (TIGR02391 family)
MDTLFSLFPTPEPLLELTPDELAPILLQLAKARRQSGMFWPSSVPQVTVGTGMTSANEFGYPYHTKARVETLLNETWAYLSREGYIMPAPDTNGRNGWMVLTSDGESVGSKEDFDRIRAAREFPKSSLHPSIAKKVYSAIMRGELDEAVFAAFKAVEVAVREAGGYNATDIGVPLMRKAFDAKNGPLADQSQPEAEREALCHLFAGAIGSYKNPHSHRTVALTDHREAQEQVLLATHLLRIVEARKP